MADRKTGLPVDPTSPLISQIISPLVPMSYQVDEPYSVNTQDIDGGVVYSETPMKVSDPQFAVPPIITGGIEFFKQFMDDPSETAGGIASAVGEELKEYPARQLRTALAGGETFNPETGEIERFDPFAVPATVAAGTAVSVARTLGKDGSGPVLGIMGGRMAKDGPSKFSQARSAKNSGKSRQEVFDEAQAYFDDDILGQDSAAFRFEIPTSNSKLNDKQVFDGRMEGFRSVERDEYDGARSVNDAPFARLEDILDFPELYQQYPEIRDLDVARINEFGGAFYHPIENYIGVADQLDNESFQSALLHEIQHWVQHKEGFPKGGNTENIQNQLAYRMEGADPEMLKGPARDLYESLYGEAEARAVQRRFLDPEEAKLTPVLTRQREASDGDVSMDEMDAVERGEQGLIEALEYGDISYSELYPEIFSGGSGKPLKRGSVVFSPSEKLARDPDTVYYKGKPLDEMSSGRLPTQFGESIGGQAVIPTMPNRFFFEDLGMSELTLRPSLDLKGNEIPNSVDIELIRAGEKGKGHGTEIMRRLTKMADETDTALTLFPTPYGDGGLDIEDLVAFYKKQGFEYLDPDPDISDLDREMVRYPRKAEGGVIALADTARNMFRGPRGVAALAPIARNMNRPMVS